MKTAVFSLIIALIVIGLAAFQFRQYKTFAKVAKKINYKLVALTQEISNLKAAENKLRLRTLEPAWQLNEIEYSLYLAEARLKGARDIKGAMELLQMAQQKLHTLHDPKLAPLSEAISKDLAALNTIPLPPTTELWLKLSTMIDKARQLTPKQSLIFQDTKEDLATKIQTETQSNLDSWKKKLLNNLKNIQELVKIRHYANPIEPLLSETEQKTLTITLCALLEQVRFVLLSEEQTIYEHALQDAKNLLTTYYDTDDPQVKNLQQTLNELAQINLHPELPTMASFAFLNQLGQ